MSSFANYLSVTELIETQELMTMLTSLITSICKHTVIVRWERYFKLNELFARSPLFAIARNCVPGTTTPYNPERVIDALRLFIDLVDVLHLDDDHWTSSSQLLAYISSYHQHNVHEGVTGDVFLWTLEVLRPDLWESCDEDGLKTSVFKCLNYGQDRRLQRLLTMCNNAIDARSPPNGYSLLHTEVVDGDPIPLLTLGANANLVGFYCEHSPQKETPISIAMYHANSFVTLQRALKFTAASFETTINQALEECSLQYSEWTGEALVELFSEDLDLSPMLYSPVNVCPYCSKYRLIMAQPYWMRILESIATRDRSQSIQDVIKTMLPTDSEAAIMSRDDNESGRLYSDKRTHNQSSEFPEVGEEHLSDEYALDQDDMATSMQSDNKGLWGFDIWNRVFIDDEDMCIFCWQKWRETGLKPSVDRSKCLCCDQRLSSPERMGKGDDSEHYCWLCTIKQRQADFAGEKGEKRYPSPYTDDPDEEDDQYSPYYIHI